MKHGMLTPATVVDHVIPHRGDQKLFWDEDNWQAVSYTHLATYPLPSIMANLDCASRQTASRICLFRRSSRRLTRWLRYWVMNNACLLYTSFDGWKLVEGRANRRYTDEVAVAQAVISSGHDPYERRLLGITAMERLSLIHISCFIGQCRIHRLQECPISLVSLALCQKI